MLSICIPTFNTDCSELLDILAKQIAQLEETLEVLVYDDFSTDYVCKNQEACERNGFLFFENQSNLGSILTRIKLAKKSSFNWLLFVDADMLPKTDEYIIQYTNFITFNKADIAIGGCCYADEIKPFNLRLKYGKNREEISAKKRQLNPYNSILFGNVLGMVPYNFTYTSHIIVTFGLAGFIFLGVTIIGILKHGINFLKFFIPSGVPIPLLPILIPIEIISYLVRPISLSLRLFANMMAGHTMLKVFASFIVLLGILGGGAPLALVVVLTGFEIMIAVLQAYVFTILCCLYLNDALNLHH